MDLISFLAAFGGGVIGAYMGALPAFIMTGFMALSGSIITAAGLAGDVSVGQWAFGSFVGPHIAFAGAVAATAYAGSKKYIDNGANILAAMYGMGHWDVLAVGGIFGLLGYVVKYVVSLLPAFGAGGIAQTDFPGTTVVVLGLIARFAFGKKGLCGEYTGTEPRTYTGGTQNMLNVAMLGAGIGAFVGFGGAVFWEYCSANYGAGAHDILQIFPIMIFAFAAITLLFTQMGFACPATHHIFLPTGWAAVAAAEFIGPIAGGVVGIIFGIATAVVGELFGRTCNSYVDTHIDPPAFTICTMTAVANLVINCCIK